MPNDLEELGFKSIARTNQNIHHKVIDNEWNGSNLNALNVFYLSLVFFSFVIVGK